MTQGFLENLKRNDVVSEAQSTNVVLEDITIFRRLHY